MIFCARQQEENWWIPIALPFYPPNCLLNMATRSWLRFLSAALNWCLIGGMIWPRLHPSALTVRKCSPHPLTWPSRWMHHGHRTLVGQPLCSTERRQLLVSAVYLPAGCIRMSQGCEPMPSGRRYRLPKCSPSAVVFRFLRSAAGQHSSISTVSVSPASAPSISQLIWTQASHSRTHLKH